MRNFLGVLAAVGMIAAASPASAKGLTKDEVRAAIIKAGPTPTFENNKWSVPLTDTLKSFVAPSVCDEGTGRCAVFTIYVLFNTKQTGERLLLLANEYNSKALLGRVGVMDEFIALQYSVIVADGAGADYLTQRLRDFPQLLGDFDTLVTKPLRETNSP